MRPYFRLALTLTIAASLAQSVACDTGYELDNTKISCAKDDDCPASFKCPQEVKLCSYCSSCVGSPPRAENGLQAPTCASPQEAAFSAIPSCATWLGTIACQCQGAASCLNEQSQRYDGQVCLYGSTTPNVEEWTRNCDGLVQYVKINAPTCLP